MVLRMNRRFMEFTRTIYPDLAKALAKQHFGYTTVRCRAGPGAGPSTALREHSRSEQLVRSLHK